MNARTDSKTHSAFTCSRALFWHGLALLNYQITASGGTGSRGGIIMHKHFYAVLVATALCANGFAQVSITGTIVDDRNNGLAGVSVALQASGESTISGDNGSFTLQSGVSSLLVPMASQRTSFAFHREGSVFHGYATPVQSLRLRLFTAAGRLLHASFTRTDAAGKFRIAFPSERHAALDGLLFAEVICGARTFTFRLLPSHRSGFHGEKRDDAPISSLRKSLAVIDTLVCRKPGYTPVKLPVGSYVLDVGTITMKAQALEGPMQNMFLVQSSGKQFAMGSTDGYGNEAPVHTVTFTYDYYIGKYEVSQKEFEEVMGAEYQAKGIELPWDAYKDADDYGSGSARGASGTPGDDYPVWYINWFGAAYYCNALSKAHGLDTVYTYASHGWNEESRDVMTDVRADYSKDGFRLSTEAEWEYACRAGTTSKYFWGDNASIAGQYAWFGDKLKHTIKVDGTIDNSVEGVDGKTEKLTANAWGLVNMNGNVGEWVSDWYQPYGGDEVNPTGAPSGTGAEPSKVLRGGSWRHKLEGMTCSCRGGIAAITRNHARGEHLYAEEGYERSGFRIARGVISK